MQKAVVMKQPGDYFDDPNPLTGSWKPQVSAPAFTLQQGGWITVHKRLIYITL